MKRLLATLALVGLVGCGAERDDRRRDTPKEEPAPDGDGQGGDDGGSDGGNLTPAEPVDVPPPDNESVAHFRGVIRVNELVHERVIKEEEQSQYFFIGGYLGGYSPEFLYGLPTLLGFVEGDGINAEFRNGEANAINMVLWNLTFSSLGNDIAMHCAPDANEYIPFNLQEDLQSTVEELCQWPDVRKRETIVAYWRHLTREDAPINELNQFTHFFLSDVYADASGPEVIRDMTVAALMNPYFLIKP